MCKTCLRKVSFENKVDSGPWGLSGTYQSAALISRRLWASHKTKSPDADAEDPIDDEELDVGCPHVSSLSPPVSDLNEVSQEVPVDCGQRSDKPSEKERDLSRVSVGGCLSATHVPSHAYPKVGADEGDNDNDLSRVNGRWCDKVNVSGIISSESNIISHRIETHSTKERDEITKDKAVGSEGGNNKRDGRQIGLAETPTGGIDIDAVGAALRKLELATVIKLDTPRLDRRPFFYLPSEDEDDSIIEDPELELLKDPDLYPVPKSALSSSPSTKEKPVHTPTTPPQTPEKQTPPSPTKSGASSVEIKNRIRHCLQRARSRSASLSGLGSFEAGLYRLEGLLEGNKEKTLKDQDDPLHYSSSYSSLNNPKARRTGHAALMPKEYKNASTITDVCTGENVAEVELISLVQEQIPRYILRADTVTEFSGYDNSDWGVSFPALKEEEVEALSPEQAEGALAYFVLCGSRVSQMTKTYNDIDAVTRLLQEKEKDLELAAKIGQQLLNRNKALEERNSLLDAEVSSLGDKITQLSHNLQMKTDLLQIYTNDVDESSCETTPTGIRLLNVDVLEHRVRHLEDENRCLRDEATQLASDTIECEDKEKELVSDVIKQLSDANLQVRQLSDDLAKKVEDSLRQQEEITQLLAQVVDLQARNKRLVTENDELANMVGVARDCQQELTMELAELKEKYAEVLDLLHDTQEQLRRVQKKNLPGSRGHHLGSSNLFSSPFNAANDSIASELQSLNSIGEEMGKGVSNSMRRTFDTVRLTSKYSGSGSQGSLSSLGYGGSSHSTPTHHPYTPSHLTTPTHMASSGGTYAMSYMGSRGSSVYSGGSGQPSLDSGADSDASLHTDSEDNYPGSHLGVPGWPGTPDLDSCLRRLGPGDRSGTPSLFLPYGCRTPDSIMSTGSGKSGMSSCSGNNSDWKLPQKLQIVKPIEGSLTLHQWSRLATPHLGGLLEEREGVAIKVGATGIEQLNLDVYSMSDVEEDEVEEEHPGKQFMSTSGVFTYTNSTILHPDDQCTPTLSLKKAQPSVLTTSSVTYTTPSTPVRAPSVPPSRRGSTATFSTNVGLAKVLNERGMNLQSGFSPTATPANSPTNSRPGSPEAEGYKLPGLEDLTKTFYYGASLLRRTFYKDSPAPQSPTGPRVNLVEQVQAIGVDRFVGSSEYALTVGGVVTSRPATSPLLHLSNLIMSSAKNTTSSSSTTTISSTATTTTNSTSGGRGLMSAPKVLSPGERRPMFPHGAPMGIPGHPGSGHLDNRLSQLKPGQRADLGTVGGRPRPTTLGSVPPRGSAAEQNVGTVGWTSFGRKGGLL